MEKGMVISYFAKLLNEEIQDTTIIKLSSGQRIRAQAWLKDRGLISNSLKIEKGFTVSELFENLNSQSLDSGNNHVPNKSISPPSASKLQVGVDIQSISEIFPCGLPSDPKNDPEMLAMYSMRELSYAQSKPNPTSTLTGLFAAKEAILKCSTKYADISELEVLPNSEGKPVFQDYEISISHSRDYVVAIAIHGGFGIENRNLCFEKTCDDNVGIQNNRQPIEGKYRKMVIPALVLMLMMIEIIRTISYKF
jgi:phosphopantetheinyl transferase (holo-ACP synthase)